MDDTLAIAQEIVDKGRGYGTWENHLAREVLRLHSLLLRAEEERKSLRQKLDWYERTQWVRRLGEVREERDALREALNHPVARLGDSLDGPGDPKQVFLIFRESAFLAATPEETKEAGEA